MQSGLRKIFPQDGCSDHKQKAGKRTPQRVLWQARAHETPSNTPYDPQDRKEPNDVPVQAELQGTQDIEIFIKAAKRFERDDEQTCSHRDMHRQAP